MPNPQLSALRTARPVTDATLEAQMPAGGPAAILQGSGMQSSAANSPLVKMAGLSFNSGLAGNRQKELALSGARDAFLGDALGEQAGNIASHGTIEDPFTFKQRTEREAAVELADPSTARGRLRKQDMDHRYSMATDPTRIAGETQRDVAGMNNDTRLLEQELINERGLLQHSWDEQAGLATGGDKSEAADRALYFRAMANPKIKAAALAAMRETLAAKYGMQPWLDESLVMGVGQ